MILTCEKCSKRYFVHDEEIGPEGRKVRCVVCNHTWLQQPLDMALPLKLDPEEVTSHPSAANESAPQRFSLGWMLFCGALALTTCTLYFGRHMIVQLWPAAAAVYEPLGMEVALPGKGLKVENVHPVHTEEHGKHILVVHGEVVNTSNIATTIPPVHIQLMGPCEGQPDKQCVVKEWQHAFSESRLLPGERIAFETEPQETTPGAKNLRVQF